MLNPVNAGAPLNAALKALGFPVGRFYNKRGTPTYFTFQYLVGVPKGFSDDDNEAVESTWRIDLFTKRDFTALLPRVIQAIKDAEFYGVTVEAEQYEHDTGYHHISLEAKYLEVDHEGN